MSLYAEIPQILKMLRNLSNWLELARAYAEERGFDPEVFLAARLAPDQFPLTRQVQSACDTAKFLGARLSGSEAPSHPDTETTLAELSARIESTSAWLGSLPEAAFAEAADRPLTLPFLAGRIVRGEDYLREFALPNFYFHTTTAYAILRHNGVPLGKGAFIGSLTSSPG